MRVIYKDAEQGHRVPKQAMPGYGPFGHYEPPKADPYPDDVGSFPVGATAQNGMREISIYVCRDCDAVVNEYQVGSHICEGEV